MGGIGDAAGIARVLHEKFGSDVATLNRLLRQRIGARGRRFTHDHPDTFMYIERSKNLNVVAYTAKMRDAATQESVPSGAGRRCVVDPDAPVHAYFITLEPSAIEARRKKGTQGDISELNFLQRTLAYGCNAKPLKEPSEAKEDVKSWFRYFAPLSVTYVALSKWSALLLVLPPLTEGTDTETSAQEATDTAVVLLAGVNGVLSVVQRVYVSSTEPKHFYQLPTVNYIELFAVALDSGEAVYEKREK
ncbi:hypothetical protein DQ04_03851060 [Trypanosoma grayi]|uniref:hypothetical protein n=1 Tax=Trypanosoma grayi TaxID=71804 RepID=UPI0004F4AB36|nr:hypothetical protein DQ04_03851060 [Trypanosoma grayi]KEG10344.1 hypothetical protein DQ04_03851060 [Trypanosoma grayi]